MRGRVRSHGRRWPSRLRWALATVAGLLLGTAGPAAADGISIGPAGDGAGALRVAFDRLEREVDAWCTQAKLVA